MNADGSSLLCQTDDGFCDVMRHIHRLLVTPYRNGQVGIFINDGDNVRQGLGNARIVSANVAGMGALKQFVAVFHFQT